MTAFTRSGLARLLSGLQLPAAASALCARALFPERAGHFSAQALERQQRRIYWLHHCHLRAQQRRSEEEAELQRTQVEREMMAMTCHEVQTPPPSCAAALPLTAAHAVPPPPL